MNLAEYEKIAQAAADTFLGLSTLDEILEQDTDVSLLSLPGSGVLQWGQEVELGSPAHLFLSALGELHALAMSTGTPPRRLVGAILAGVPEDEDWHRTFVARRAAVAARLAAEVDAGVDAEVSPDDSLGPADAFVELSPAERHERLADVTRGLVEFYLEQRRDADEDPPSASTEPADERSYARSLLTVSISGLLDAARLSGVPPQELVEAVLAGLPNAADWTRRLDAAEALRDGFFAGAQALESDDRAAASAKESG